MDITDWRKQIDEIDTTMLNLLNRRTELALEVARAKTREGIALRTPARERAIIERMKSLNSGPLEAATVVKIYKLILAESTRMQKLHCSPAGAKLAKKKRR